MIEMVRVNWYLTPVFSCDSLSTIPGRGMMVVVVMWSAGPLAAAPPAPLSWVSPREAPHPESWILESLAETASAAEI